MPPDLPLPVNTALSPRFHELSFENFQRLCREILAHEPGVRSCDLYGISGQAQRGIDLLAPLEAEGSIGGECKCYTEFTPRHMEEAVQRFLDNLEHWRARGVRHLILFVACEADRTEVREAEITQRARLAAVGVAFDVWLATTITRKLRPHRGLVASILGIHWVAYVCGPEAAMEKAHAAQPMIDLALGEQIVGLAATISRETDAQVATLRRSWREGRKRDVLAWLDDFEGDRTRQTAAGPAVTAKVFRFHAGLLLEDGRVSSKASDLAARARTLHPGPEDARILAVIALRERGVDAALQALAGTAGTAIAHLKAGILLEAGRPHEALEALTSAGPETSSDRAQHARLQAISLFATGRLQDAIPEAQRALDAEPRWTNVRFLAGFLDYQAGLSPAVTAGYIPGWPEPVGAVLVRQDDAGVASTERALARFREVLSDESDDEERRRLESWVLACLATLPGRRDEAIAWCGRILQREPAHPYAAVWAVAHRFPLDLEPSRQALLAEVEAHPTPALFVALCAIHLGDGSPESGLRLLEDAAEVFDQSEAAPLRRLWQVQLLSAAGQSEEAERLVGQETAEDQSVIACRTAIARARMAETGDTATYLQHLDAALIQSGNPQYLIEICELAAEAGQWEDVARHAPKLIDWIGTAYAVHLGAMALDNVERHAECLRFLEDRASSFAPSPLGPDILGIRGFARHATGNLMGAIADLEAVVAQRPRIREQFALAQLYFAKGDFERLVPLARQLRLRDDLPVQVALWLAEALPREHNDLAVALWRVAFQLGIPDDDVGASLTLGSRLGLESETRPLHIRMMELAREGRGGIQVFTVDELIAMSQERMTGQQELARQYERGELAVHILSASHRLPLVEPYHVWLEDGAANPDFVSRRIVRTRYAGRPHPSASEIDLGGRRLTMDVTALLLAHHLDILQMIESDWGPIRIPQTTVRALREMSQAIVHHQPSRLAIYRNLLEAEDRALLHARPDPRPSVGEAAYVLDFSSAARHAEPRLVNARDLVESLRENGPLTASQYEIALEALGSEGVGPVRQEPLVQRRHLYCANGAIETLVNAGLLPVLCERFSVVVGTEDQAARRRTLEWEARGQRAAAWLRSLISRLSDGLANGKYEFLPLIHQTEEESAALRDPVLGALAETLRAPGAEADLLWVDDRAVNRHAFGNGTRIVDVLDVLWALRSNGALDDEHLFELIQRLRAANVRYLPVTRDEIVHHVRQATCRNGTIIETGGLAVLRRYVAGCLVDGADLDIPPSGKSMEGPAGELPFILGLGHETMAAVTELWRDPALVPDFARAGSDWIVNSLNVDLALLRAATAGDALPPSLEVSAVGLTGWIVRAVGLLPLLDRVSEGNAREYMGWVESRLIEPRTTAEPELLPAVAAVLRHHFFGVIQGQPEEVALAHRLLVARRIADLLSEQLGQLVNADPAFQEHIGVRVIPVRGDDDLQFPSRDFIVAAEAALRGETTTVRSVDSDLEVLFEPAEQPALFRYTHPTTGQIRNANDPLLMLLSPDRPVHESLLRDHPEWFDMPAQELRVRMDELGAAPDPEARYNLGMQWRVESAALHYEQLRSHLTRGERVTEETLRSPAAASLRLHVGLPSQGTEPFAREWPAAAQRLLAERDIAVALDRIAGLPVVLPAAAFEALDRLPEAELKERVKAWLSRATSPLEDVHLLRLLEHLSGRDPVYARMGRRVARQLLSPEWQRRATTFLRLLRWVEADVRSASPEAAVDGGERLALIWYHAHRLFIAFVDAGADLNRLGELFEKLRQEPAWGTFDLGSMYRRDAAHPLHLSASRFTLAGLGYAVDRSSSRVWSEDAKELLLRRCFREVDGELMPDVILLADPSRMEDSLGSFLHLDQADCAHLLGTAPAQALGADRSARYVDEAIALLESDPNSVPGWIALAALLQEQPIQRGLTDRLRTVLERVELAPLADLDAGSAAMVLQAVTWSTMRVGDDDRRARIEAQLVEIAARMADVPPTAADEDRGLDWFLVEAAAILSSGDGLGLQARAGRFAGILARLFEVSPRLGGLTRPAIQRFVDRLPLQAARPLATLLFLARRAA